MANVIQVRCIKGKGMVPLDLDELPEEVYEAFVRAGAEVFVNKLNSKFTKTAYPNEDELQAAAMAKAQENATELVKKDEEGNYVGSLKLKARGASATVVKGELRIEAMAIAKRLVKDTIKAEKKKIGDFKPSQITEWAKQVLTGDLGSRIIDQAKAAIEARAKANEGITLKLELVEDAALVARNVKKRATEKAARTTQLSAKQAGMIEARTKKPSGVSARPN